MALADFLQALLRQPGGPQNALAQAASAQGTAGPVGTAQYGSVLQAMFQPQSAPQVAPQAPSQGVSPVTTGSVPSAPPSAQASSPAAPAGNGLSGLFQGLENIFNPQARGRNATINYLTKQGYDPGTAMLIAGDKPLLRQVLIGGKGKSEFDQRAAAAKEYGLDPTTDIGRSYILTGKLPEQRGGTAELGLNPQYGVDDQGNPVLLQLGKDGKVVQSQLPAGVHLAKQPIKVDLGTSFALIDPITRQVIGSVPKDLEGAAAAEAKGKATGALQASLPSDILNTQQALQDIDSLINNPGLNEVVGGLDQYRPSWMMDAQGRDALARLKQIKGKTFLQAYATLKGGGSITEVEGAKAEDAIARLDRAQDETTFKSALSDLREVIAQGQKVMLKKAGIPESDYGKYLPQRAQPATASQPARSGGSDLPPGVTEEDMQYTMKARNMTRQQVLDALKKNPAY